MQEVRDWREGTDPYTEDWQKERKIAQKRFTAKFQGWEDEAGSLAKEWYMKGAEEVLRHGLGASSFSNQEKIDDRTELAWLAGDARTAVVAPQLYNVEE